MYEFFSKLSSYSSKLKTMFSFYDIDLLIFFGITKHTLQIMLDQVVTQISFLFFSLFFFFSFPFMISSREKLENKTIQHQKRNIDISILSLLSISLFFFFFFFNFAVSVFLLSGIGSSQFLFSLLFLFSNNPNIWRSRSQPKSISMVVLFH